MGRFGVSAASVLSQKFPDKVLLMPEGFLQPRQGRNSVAQGESPGKNGPTPFCSPSPAWRGRGPREGPHPGPTACAVGHTMTPVGSRADFFNELLTQDTRKQSLLTPSGAFFVYL